MITNALSVDVEEYYHAAIFRKGTDGLDARRFESRVEESLERLLALLQMARTEDPQIPHPVMRKIHPLPSLPSARRRGQTS
jgi:hypothetical protein